MHPFARRLVLPVYNFLSKEFRGVARWSLNRATVWLAPKDKIARGSDGAPFPLVDDFRQQLTGTPHVEILLFGDSVMERVSNKDADTRPLAEMLAHRLAGRSYHAVTMSAYTCQMFEPLLVLAGKLGAKPDHIVLPFNLRCLSPQWDSCPMWQYTLDRAIVEAMIVDPQAPIVAKGDAPHLLEVYEAAAFSSPLSSRRSVREFRDVITGRYEDKLSHLDREREILVYHYGMPARESHRQLLFLRAAVTAASALGARVLVYLTPVNLAYIEQSGGAELVAILRANVRLVCAAGDLPSESVVVRDWSETLAPDLFFSPHEKTEHLRETGRLRLAELIATEIENAG